MYSRNGNMGLKEWQYGTQGMAIWDSEGSVPSLLISITLRPLLVVGYYILKTSMKALAGSTSTLCTYMV